MTLIQCLTKPVRRPSAKDSKDEVLKTPKTWSSEDSSFWRRWLWYIVKETNLKTKCWRLWRRGSEDSKDLQFWRFKFLRQMVLKTKCWRFWENLKTWRSEEPKIIFYLLLMLQASEVWRIEDNVNVVQQYMVRIKKFHSTTMKDGRCVWSCPPRYFKLPTFWRLQKCPPTDILLYWLYKELED